MEEIPRLPPWLWAVAGLVSIGLVGLGSLFVLLPILFPGSFAAAAVVTVGYGLIALTLGCALLVAAARGWRRLPDRRYYSRWGWLAFLLGSVAVGVAGVLLPATFQNRPIFAPFHSALILLPGLLLFSLVVLVAGPQWAVSLRQIVLSVVGGAGSIILAIPLEIVGVVLSGVVGVVAVSALSGDTAEAERLVVLLQQWAQRPPTDETEILGVLASPIVLLTLALTLGVVTPLAEEFGKTLVIGVMGFWIKPAMLTGFIWGMACGLGFAWFEGVSNGALGLGGAVVWLGSVGVRFLATAMHALTSGVLGLGWARFWQGRRGSLPVAYAVAVIFHGLWNLNIILSLGGVGLAASSPVAGGLIVVVGGVIQVVLILLSLSALFAIPWLLQRRAAHAG